MYSALPRYAATRIHMLCSVCIVHSCWFEGKLWRLLRDPLVFIHVVLRLYPLQLQSPLSKINFLFFHRKIMDQIKSNQIEETLLKLDVVTVQCTVTTSNIIRVNSKDILQYFKNLWRALGCSVPCEQCHCHRIIIDRMEHTINGSRIRHNLR